MTERPAWQKDAACRGLSPALFFTESHHVDQAVLARAVCATCPVQEECLDYALVNNERFGTWGGRSVKERIALRRERGLSHPWGHALGERSA